LLRGDPLEVTHHGGVVALALDEPATRPIPPAPSRRAPDQPPGRAPSLELRVRRKP
jgi:alpha,alpha-trehalose phosphorylase